MFPKNCLTYLFLVVYCVDKATSHLEGVTYTSTSPSCGGSYYTDSGSLQTDNYPSNYSNTDFCIWTISISSGSGNRSLTLTFDSFQTEFNYDVLEVREGLSSYGIQIGRYSGQRPDPITISSGNVWLKFTSDSSVVNSGFRITWRTNIGTENCGGSYSGNIAGTLQSPRFPSSYRNTEYCVWTIAPNALSSPLRLNFSNIEISYGGILEIREGNNPFGTYLGSYTDFQQAFAIEATSFWIRFTSEYYSTRSYGFRATWGTAEYITTTRSPSPMCTRDFDTATGSLSTPNFPYAYNNDVVCVWRIMQPSYNYRSLTLTFDSFQTNDQDVLEIGEGLDQSGSYMVRYSGSSRPSPLTVYGRNVWLKFTSGSVTTTYMYRTYSTAYNTESGFSITWTTNIGNAYCGGSYSYLTEGTIQSSNYPSLYYNNEYCVWTIELLYYSNPIRLKFDSLHTEWNADTVEIYEGTNQYGYSRGTYSGTNTPDSIYIYGGKVWIRFKTDSSVTYKGFQLSWKLCTYYDCYGEDDNKVGLIVGCTLGALALIGLLITCCICRRRCRKSSTDKSTLVSPNEYDNYKPLTSKLYDKLTSYPFVQKLQGWKSSDKENSDTDVPHSSSARLIVEY